MRYCNDIELALLLALVQVASISSELSVDNDTDCGERNYDEECGSHPASSENAT